MPWFVDVLFKHFKFILNLLCLTYILIFKMVEFMLKITDKKLDLNNS